MFYLPNHFQISINHSHNGFNANEHIHGKNVLNPLVDDGAPYSAIGYVELQLLLNHMNGFSLDSIPSCLEGVIKWHYGSGEHSSASRNIMGSFMLTDISDNGIELLIRHLFSDGSSQLVIGNM